MPKNTNKTKKQEQTLIRQQIPKLKNIKLFNKIRDSYSSTYC